MGSPNKIWRQIFFILGNYFLIIIAPEPIAIKEMLDFIFTAPRFIITPI